jgi:hypothetical protein
VIKHEKASVIAALAAMVVSSATLAEGGADRVYGRMIQANEQAMQEYAAANGRIRLKLFITATA